MIGYMTHMRQLQTLCGFCTKWASIPAFFPFLFTRACGRVGTLGCGGVVVEAGLHSLCINLTPFKTSTPYSRNLDVRGARAGREVCTGWSLTCQGHSPLGHT